MNYKDWKKRDMSRYYLKSNQIFLENEIFKGYILVNDGIIEDIISEPFEGDINIIDYENKIIAAGFVDTHVHGYGGYDIMDRSTDSVINVAKGLLSTGVTSFLPTTLTDSREKLIEACKVVADTVSLPEYKNDKCATIVGIFLEGTFFSEVFKGAQDERFMSDPDFDTLKELYDVSNGLVNKIAIAAERENTEDFIKRAGKLGIKVALGHSNATYEQAKRAVDLGANIFVHTYNAMSPLHHRNPGMVGAALSTEDTFSEVICDGHHVHPAAVKVVMRAKGKRRTMLITDCMMAGGKEDGMYKLGNFDVKVENGTARLKSGALAGSILRMDRAVKNVIKWGLADKPEAVNMASIVPARSLGLDDKIGSISVGKCADFNILDEDMNIEHVYVDGIKQI